MGLAKIYARRGRRRGWKVRVQLQGGHRQQKGYGGRYNAAWQDKPFNRDDDNKVRRHCTGYWDCTDGATVPPQAVDGDDGGAVGVRRQDGGKPARHRRACCHGGGSGSTRSGRPSRKTRGGVSPMAFLGLNASTQLAGLDTASQGVARPTNGGN